jgi:hypothetical protein
MEPPHRKRARTPFGGIGCCLVKGRLAFPERINGEKKQIVTND